jgi:hypothetical protein
MAEDCDKLNELLKHGIIADADHDFGLKPGDIETILKGTDESICPGIPERGSGGGFQTYDEDNLLFELLNKENEYGFDGEKGFNTNLLKTLQENSYRIFLGDVGYESNTYAVSLLHDKGEINIKTLTEESKIKEADIHSFFNDMAFTDQNILIDSGSIEFLNFFEKKGYHVSRVINREKINDPCPSSKTLGELEGVTDILDIDVKGNDPDNKIDGDILYSDSFKIFNYDKFFSKYDFYLSPLKRKIPGNPNSQLYTRLRATIEWNKNYESNDSRDNSIKKCKEELSQSPEQYWPFIYQRKRAGDWLMVLSTFDTKRVYVKNNTDEKKMKKVTMNKVVIKTVDRILLWYALLLGADVLYEAQGSLIFFRNTSRKGKKQSKVVAKEQEPIAEPVAEPVAAPVTEVEMYNGKWNVYAMMFYNDLTENKQNILKRAELFKWYNQKGHRKNVLHEDDIDAVELSIEKGKKFTASELLKLYNHGFINLDTYNKIISKSGGSIISQSGGSMKSAKKHCEDYITELINDLECFESEENSDYNYYEKTAFIVLACLNEYRDSANVYEQMQAILFDILPSIEGYIKCKQPDILQFFKEDKYTADCTAYAARNIALHSLGLRTGSIENMGYRDKYSVQIPPSAVDYYKKVEKHLEKSNFEERKIWLIEQLQAYHKLMHSSTHRVSASKNRAYASRRRMTKHKYVSVGGYRSTRRKSRK